MMKKPLGTSYLMIAAFLAAMASAASIAQAFTISGRIAVVGGGGSRGVTVWIDYLHWTRTDSLGNYTFTRLGSGNYAIKVWAPSCLASVFDTVEIRNADVAGVNGTIVAGDIVEDGRINLYDAGELLRHYGATPDSVSWDGALDFDGSGTIDSLDTAALMSCWKDTSDVAPPAFLEVTEPNSATVWFLGQQDVPFHWTTGNLNGPVEISLLWDHDLIARIEDSTPNDGSYTEFDVPLSLAPGTVYRILVSQIDSGASALSEYFEVRQHIIVTEPTSATVWKQNQTNVPIVWTTGDLGGTVDVELYKGVDLVLQWPDVPNDGADSVDVPPTASPGSDYRILVRWDANHSDYSSYFAIQEVPIVVTEPTSATVWHRGQASVPIAWETGNLGGQVDIHLYEGESPRHGWYDVPNNGSYTINVPTTNLLVGSNHRILIWNATHSDFSDYFAIQDTNRIFVTAPDSAAVWAVGTKAGSIRWNAGYGLVSIDLYKGSSPARGIRSEAPNIGSYEAYNVPLDLPPGNDYRVFVQYAKDGIGGFSDFFEVRQCIIVTEPTSATVWNRGQANAAIKWNTGNLGGTVDIELYNSGTRARQWAGVSNSGAYSVAVPTDVLTGSDYRILVRWDASRADTSDYFTIRDTSVVVVTPNGNTAWMCGQQNVAINWNWTSMTGSVSIDLYRGGSTVGTIASSTPNDGEYSEYGVPLWLASGTDYRVRIESDTGDFVFSDYFTIEHPSGWVWLYPSTGGYRLNSVCFTDANTGTAVGEYGTILRTTDGGVTWIKQWGGTRKKLYGVDFSDANTGLAVGENGLILKTTDGGATWAGRRSGVLGGALHSVAFADADTVVAVGALGSGTVFCRSTDGGETWTSAIRYSSSMAPAKSVSFSDAKNGAALAEYGGVYWTNDGGVTWNGRSAGGDLNHCISVLDANTWVIGVTTTQYDYYGLQYIGEIRVTRNAGATWGKWYSGPIRPYSISFGDAMNGTAVGLDGGILRTTNGGSLWTPQTSGLSASLYGVSFVDANTGSAVGTYGRIVGTTDGGATWNLQTPSTSGTLSDISFSDENQGIIVGGSGSSGVVLRTTDAGVTWSSLPTSGGALNDISMANADTGTAVGSYFVPCIDCGGWPGSSYGVILRTTDGGATWVQQKSLSTMLGCLWFTDPNTGIVFAWSPTAAASVLRTWDGGATWTSSSFAYKIEDVWFVDANTGIAVGGSGTIVRSVDGGATWTPQTSGTSNHLACVHFIDESTGTAVGNGGTILRTVDGGATWIPQTSGTARHLLDVRFFDANTGIAVGIDGMILRTTDGGATWVRQDGGTTSDLYAVYLMNVNTAFVSGEGGAILKTTTGGE